MDGDKRSAQAGRLEVVETGRRRRWTEDEKVRIVLESLAGPRRVSATARRYDISRSLLTQWRRSFRPELKDGIGKQQIGFVPAKVVEESKPAPVPVPDAPAAGGTIEIELPTGARIRIEGVVDAATLQATVAALRGQQR
jgi:transposase